MLYDDGQGDCITPEHVFDLLEEDLEVGGGSGEKLPVVIAVTSCHDGGMSSNCYCTAVETLRCYSNGN